MTGDFSVAAGITLGAADFTLANGIIGRGGTFMNVRVGIESTDVTVIEGSLHGEFIGEDAQYLGGVVAIDTDLGSVAGVFVTE